MIFYAVVGYFHLQQNYFVQHKHNNEKKLSDF